MNPVFILLNFYFDQKHFWHAACYTLVNILKTTVMKELKEKYLNAKQQAKKLMKTGNVSGYIAQLAQVQDLQMQLFNFALNPTR